ncbi:golgi-body localization protein domain-containing protein [Parasitella parasitica]|nr:golgi-body localization protein domain-containing protein [Parasitella parasitica]
MDFWLFLTTFLLLVSLPLYVHRELIWGQIKIQLRKKFGLVDIDQFCIFYDKQNSKLTVHIIGVELQEVPSVDSVQTTTKSTNMNSNTDTPAKKLPAFVTTAIETLIEFPVLLIVSLVVNHIALHIDKLKYNKHDLALKLDHVYVHSKLTTSKLLPQLFQERMFVVQIQVGPVTVAEQKETSKPLVEMTTACLLMVSCQLETRTIIFKDVDLDIQLGIFNIFLNQCMNYMARHRQQAQPEQHKQEQQQHLDISRSKFMRLGHKIKSFGVTIQRINLEYQQIAAFSMEINSLQIQAFSKCRTEPSIHFNTKMIVFCLQELRIIEIASMEIITAIPLPDEHQNDLGSQYHPNVSSDTLPHMDLLSVTWIINAPVLILPLNSQIFLATLAHLQQKNTPATATATATAANYDLPQKRISNLPACTFAVVLNAARLDILDVDGDKRSGYISSKSLIVRCSGEYMKQSTSNRNSSVFVDVPSSSSSSSASRFDSWFAQEEYKWLSGGSFSSLQSKNRTSTHELGLPQQQQQQQQQHPKPTSTAMRWLKLLGRVSRRYPISPSPTPAMSSQQRHQKWVYRLSLKIITQHVNFGYQHQQQTYDFVRIKNVVFIVKSGMNVIQNQIVFTAGNIVQSEAAIDKPLVYLWDTHHDTTMSASIFWLKSVPYSLRSLIGSNSRRVDTVAGDGPDWKKILARSISFSLDVTEGSIIAFSFDAPRSRNEKAPQGYVDNSPTDAVYTRMALDIQKLTFVREAPYAVVNQHFANESKTRCHVEKMYLHQSSSCLQQDVDISELLERPEKQHVILWISQFNFTTKLWHTNEKQLFATVKVKKFGISYSIRNHYACLLLSKSLFAMKSQFGNDDKGNVGHQQQATASPKSVLQVSLDLSIGRGDVQIGLPQERRLYLRMDELDIKRSIKDRNDMVQFRNIMLLGVSPTDCDKWEQLVEVDQLKITAISAIELKAKKVLASIPHKFVLSEIIDSVIGLIKAIKELHARILEKDPYRRVFTYFGPSVKNNPVEIPHIKLQAKVFSVHFDDDPFEAKLRNIFRTGLQEQQRRLAYREALDDKIYDMLHSTSPYSTPETGSAGSSIYQQTKATEELEPICTLPATINATTTDNTEIYAQIAEAQKNLLEFYSGFWIKHINETNSEEFEFFEALHIKNNYRNSITSEDIDRALDDGDSRRHDRFLLSKTFTIDIVPRPLYPPLANFTVEYAKVAFKSADFMLEETRSFVQMVGSGVPLNNNFSVLIPFHLSIKASKTWIKIRDYSLPLLYVPPSAAGQIAWTLEGDYVLGDELGNSGGSRIIPIVIIPSASTGYRLSAVRTASPLKFYSVIDYHVFAQGTSMICWSISYSPAIQDILRVLDNLTPAQVDPSPRIGFWDKVRFMIHSQIKIQFSGGGKLALVVKGTRDPYQLSERGAGIAKIWSDGVVWLLGHENDQNEFMQIISESYTFGVPDLIHSGFVPQLPDSLPHKQDRIIDDGNRVFLKVILKLSDGFRMGIGLSYERLSCHGEDASNNTLCINCKYQDPHVLDRCRSQVFMPHYNVLYQSAQYVNAHYDKTSYDAFRGFRSDFIHLSFSMVKLDSNCGSLQSPDFSKDDPYFNYSGNVSQNAMYLSPCFITHFQKWIRLFGSPVSIPIRQGKLFPTTEAKAKPFGELLNTIKYKIEINPLAIGMLISDQETYLNMKGGVSAGMKARVSTFSVDMHSRKEVIRPNSMELSSIDEPVKTAFVLHEAEVELSDIDLRVIKAYHRKSANGSKAPSRSYSAKSISGSTIYSEEQSYRPHDAPSFDDENHYSFPWIDAKDFVILDAVHQLPPLSQSKIEVFPFAFSPLFYYNKQHDEPGAEKRDYLRRTHECTIKNGMDSHEFQKSYLNQRAADLDIVIENHDKQLDIILHAMNVYKNEKKDLALEYDLLKQKMDNLRVKRYMLHNYIAQLILETELNMTTSDPSSGRDSPQTTTSSIGRRDELSRWEALMGRFKDRCFVYNPQIIWNSSVRDSVYHLRKIYTDRSLEAYNLSARCLKFLDDLVLMAEKQQQWKPDAPNAATTSASNANTPPTSSPSSDDINTTQALIDRLLSERPKNFVAYHEREKGKKQQKKSINSASSTTGSTYDGIYVLDDSSENVNDPDYQYENVPDCYEMQSGYLIDMINPQFICQSEEGLDHLVLLTNERIHIKGFRIIDTSVGGAADKDVRLVKSRIIAGLHNAQLLVAKKIDETHPYHSLARNCYGQFQERHWAAWTQPEQLWYYRDIKCFENFQRIASQLSGTMQLDLYNHLRIKINKDNGTSRKSPFEDRTNTIQLHFPHVKIVLNSLQSHILYYTAIHLVLGNNRSPREKTKLNKFQDVMLAAERSDLAETVKQVGVLQNRSRYLLGMHSRFLSELPYLDPLGLREFNKNKKKLSESLEKLYMVVEAIRSIRTFRKDVHLEETDSAKRFIFTSNEIIWEATMDDENQSSLCEWKLINTKYVQLDKSNGSHKSTVEVDKFHVKNTTESPVFVNVVDAYIDPSTSADPETDFSRYKMLSGVLDTLPPVGGIPVIQHLEINLMPLHVQISTAFGTAMKDYFFPRIASESSNHSEDDLQDQDMLSEEEDEEDDYDDEAAVDDLTISRTNSNDASVHSFGKREGSFANLDLIAKKVKQTVVKKRKGKADELTVMKKRSSTNRTFIYVRIPAAKHCISFQGPSQNTFYNLYNFPFKQPKLEYRNKTWSAAEMIEEIQKQLTRAILRHSPALLKKKLLTKNSRDKQVALKRTSNTTSKLSPSASLHSSVDLMNNSFIYSGDDDAYGAPTSRPVSIHGQDDIEDDGIENDVKSLYSVDPEEEQQRLAELQTIEKKESHNVDQKLLDFYMQKYKPEHESHTTDELTKNSQILFGPGYRSRNASISEI